MTGPFRIVDAGHDNELVERSIPTWEQALETLRLVRLAWPGRDFKVVPEVKRGR